MTARPDRAVAAVAWAGATTGRRTVAAVGSSASTAERTFPSRARQPASDEMRLPGPVSRQSNVACAEPEGYRRKSGEPVCCTVPPMSVGPTIKEQAPRSG